MTCTIWQHDRTAELHRKQAVSAAAERRRTRVAIARPCNCNVTWVLDTQRVRRFAAVVAGEITFREDRRYYLSIFIKGVFAETQTNLYKDDR